MVNRKGSRINWLKQRMSYTSPLERGLSEISEQDTIPITRKMIQFVSGLEDFKGTPKDLADLVRKEFDVKMDTEGNLGHTQNKELVSFENLGETNQGEILSQNVVLNTEKEFLSGLNLRDTKTLVAMNLLFDKYLGNSQKLNMRFRKPNGFLDYLWTKTEKGREYKSFQKITQKVVRNNTSQDSGFVGAITPCSIDIWKYLMQEESSLGRVVSKKVQRKSVIEQDKEVRQSRLSNALCNLLYTASLISVLGVGLKEANTRFLDRERNLTLNSSNNMTSSEADNLVRKITINSPLSYSSWNGERFEANGWPVLKPEVSFVLPNSKGSKKAEYVHIKGKNGEKGEDLFLCFKNKKFSYLSGINSTSVDIYDLNNISALANTCEIPGTLESIVLNIPELDSSILVLATTDNLNPNRNKRTNHPLVAYAIKNKTLEKIDNSNFPCGPINFLASSKFGENEVFLTSEDFYPEPKKSRIEAYMPYLINENKDNPVICFKPIKFKIKEPIKLEDITESFSVDQDGALELPKEFRGYFFSTFSNLYGPSIYLFRPNNKPIILSMTYSSDKDNLINNSFIQLDNIWKFKMPYQKSMRWCIDVPNDPLKRTAFYDSLFLFFNSLNRNKIDSSLGLYYLNEDFNQIKFAYKNEGNKDEGEFQRLYMVSMNEQGATFMPTDLTRPLEE